MAADTDLRKAAQAAHNLRHHDTLEAAKAKVDLIALANPAAILALLDALTAERTAREKAEAERDEAQWEVKVLEAGEAQYSNRVKFLGAAISASQEEVKRWTALALHLHRCLGEDGNSVWHQANLSVSPEEALADLKEALKETPHE